ncbi:MAG: glycosyltransferase [Anaeromyxobacter sp.]
MTTGHTPRVLMVAHGYPPHGLGGVEVSVQRLAHAVRDQGWAVSVLHPVETPPEPACRIARQELDGVAVHRLHGPQNDLVSTLSHPGREAAFAAFLRDGRFDVVHFHHTSKLPMRLVRVAREAGLPVALTLHDFWFLCQRIHLYVAGERRVCPGPASADACVRCATGAVWERLAPAQQDGLVRFSAAREGAAAEALRAAHLLAAPSRFVAGVFARSAVGKGLQVEVAPLGLPAGAPPRTARPEGPLTLGYLGTVHELKGVFELVEAFAQVRGDARLVIRGGGVSADVAALRQAAKDPRITVGGPYAPPELGSILPRLDALVVPSRIESYCLTAREALAAGVPVIASRVGGLPEAVVHGRNGLLFDLDAPGELARVLQAVVDEPALLAGLRPVPVAPPLAVEAAGCDRALRAAVRPDPHADPAGDQAGASAPCARATRR